eukprot:CAMPEP_0197039778 /NCGR_PEP_ID=MMETSP1384-20130603/16555_1 /TAXON_ID=29189 /ORGANISM="Ammonia sp." /LENGTH=118 /DNA_ID=CAMNT_0042470429 /DNA_START=11 /DNA_END=363 /DNA_ORIENTATION=-
MELEHAQNNLSADAAVDGAQFADADAHHDQRATILHAELQAPPQVEEDMDDEEQAGEGLMRETWTSGGVAARVPSIEQRELDVVNLWLRDTVGLSGYYDNFVKNGYEKMDFIKEIQET